MTEKEAVPESRQAFEVAAARTCFLLSKWFLECEHPLIDKPMVIAEPTVPSAQLVDLGLKIYPSGYIQCTCNEKPETPKLCLNAL